MSGDKAILGRLRVLNESVVDAQTAAKRSRTRIKMINAILKRRL